MSFSETAAYFKKRFALEASLEEIKADWISMSIEKIQKPGASKAGNRGVFVLGSKTKHKNGRLHQQWP